LNPWRLEVYPELGSTSDDCTARARAGEPAGLAILAHRQTAGRGSRGRAWVAPSGNLNLSVLLRPATPAAQAGLFSLLAGLAVVEALGTYLPTPPSLKWPNDVLLGGAKLAGILIDAAPAGAALDWLVIGIGVNLAAAPEIPGRATTCLAAHGAVLRPEQAAAAILARLAAWEDAPPAAIRAAWLAHAHPLGTELSVNNMSGRFAGLSQNGELLLDTGGMIKQINTGEVLLGG